jgi:hypothetical protein
MGGLTSITDRRKTSFCVENSPADRSTSVDAQVRPKGMIIEGESRSLGWRGKVVGVVRGSAA